LIDELAINKQVNGVYELKNFSVKEESQQYSSGAGLGFEVILNRNSTINTLEDMELAPKIPFVFCDLNVINNAKEKSKIGSSQTFVS
jgi:hypothetical protein